MPLLPLPIGGANIGAGDLPVVDNDSIAALEPHLVQDSDDAPVRDAIRAALVAMFTYYQDQTSLAALQSSVLFATGIYLDGLGRDEGVFRQSTEPYTQAGDAAYRARIILQGGTVTPQAILAAVNSLLAPYSTIPARYLESIMDRGYTRSSTANPQAAYVRDGSTIGNCDPTYVDRVYKDDAASNLGQWVDSRHPGGFWSFSDDIGRLFVLRIPSLAAVDSSGAYAFDGTLNGNGVTPESLGYGLFCTDGSVVPQTWWDFFRNAPATATGVYQEIVNTVNRLVGHSIRWELVPDPLLA